MARTIKYSGPNGPFHRVNLTQSEIDALVQAYVELNVIPLTDSERKNITLLEADLFAGMNIRESVLRVFMEVTARHHVTISVRRRGGRIEPFTIGDCNAAQWRRPGTEKGEYAIRTLTDLIGAEPSRDTLPHTERFQHRSDPDLLRRIAVLERQVAQLLAERNDVAPRPDATLITMRPSENHDG